MTNLQANGKKVLEGGRPEVFSKKTSRYVVRIGYTSEGGEALCCDSEPMTGQSAKALDTQLSRHTRVMIYKQPDAPEHWNGFRFVRFPHNADPIETLVDQPFDE